MYEMTTVIETATKTITRTVTCWSDADLDYERAYSRSLAPRGSYVDIKVRSI